MAICKTKVRIRLDDGNVLYFVRENHNREVICALVHQVSGKLEIRGKLTLTLSEAMRASRGLAGISVLDPTEPADDLGAEPLDFEDEDTLEL